MDETLTRIMADHPELTDFGFGVFDEKRRTPAERAAELALNRARMLTPSALDQYQRARVWLRQFPKLSKLNTRGTSYGLKHVAAHDIDYVTNGMFIAAAIAEGFDIKRPRPDCPNVWLNISMKAWQPAFRRAA